MSPAQHDRSSTRDLVLDALLEQVPVIVFATGADGVCTYSEGAGLATLGLGPGQMVGVDVFEAYADMPRELGFLREGLSGRHVSYTWRTGDLAFDTWLSPLHGHDGRVDGLMGITLDVSEKVRVQDDLDLHRAVVDAAPQFVALASIDGSVRYVNPGGRRLAGIPDDVDVSKTSISDYLTEAGLRLSLEVEQPAVLAQGYYDGESTLRHWPSGRGIPVRVSSFLVTDQFTGKPRALATVQTDITAQREAQRETERRLSQQRGLLLHLHEAQETERRRIAGEVHDDTIQAVAAVAIRLQSALRQLERQGHDEAAALLAPLGDSVREATLRLRRMLYDLDVPRQLDQDLLAALRDHVGVVCRDEPFDCVVRGSLVQPPPLHVSRVLFRIAQEALANVRSHAAATTVVVEVGERDSGYTLSVRDDGKGLPSHLAVAARGRPAAVAGHLGLRSMAERAESVGGWCSVRGLDGHDGGGTLVEAWLPSRLDYSASAAGPSGYTSTSQNLLEQTVESISEGFAALDRDWRYVYVNQVGADIVRRHDLPGKVCWEEFDFSAETEAAYRDALRLQRPTVARVLYPDLGRWVENRVFPSQDGIAVFFRDVTTEYELEQQAAHRQRVLLGVQELVGVLTREPDLERALIEGLTGLRGAWGLGALSLDVECPTGGRVHLDLGDAVEDTGGTELPVQVRGELIGTLRASATPLAGELRSVCDLLALRIAGEREPNPSPDRSEGHARADF